MTLLRVYIYEKLLFLLFKPIKKINRLKIKKGE